MKDFEWDEDKARLNLARHDISFERAVTVFEDVFAIERLDDRGNYGEERFILLGLAEGGVLLAVVYTERDERTRIISARKATKHEQDIYFRENVGFDTRHDG